MILRKSSIRFFSSEFKSLPKPPAGTGVVFHGNMQQVKYAIDFSSYILIVFSGFMGAISGNFFYKKFILRKNPPNPLRDPLDLPPEKHPHTPEDD
ncbi:conserved Plasmodium protein, unknown function [Plasmodium relictum]|uniref:Uncharacterized protein n=1 Tax=Plasmodium relictum TaxID=85471 RepID=A0A1J1H3V6_PLARL|nr:conserved Plasmodium protein, unknown function [Plasmodium relictum]CRG99583.1 conserved Plasmodium protein, unknown function [Plasmodium relictum]